MDQRLATSPNCFRKKKREREREAFGVCVGRGSDGGVPLPHDKVDWIQPHCHLIWCSLFVQLGIKLSSNTVIHWLSHIGNSFVGEPQWRNEARRQEHKHWSNKHFWLVSSRPSDGLWSRYVPKGSSLAMQGSRVLPEEIAPPLLRMPATGRWQRVWLLLANVHNWNIRNRKL